MGTVKLVSPTGQPIESPARSEEGIEGRLHQGRHTSQVPYAERRSTPWAWHRGTPTKGMKVGWELRLGGKVQASFAFSINPQSITRMETPRAQLYAVRSRFYVDDFGAGAGTIQISQMVGSAKGPKEDLIGGVPTGPLSLRDDVLHFYNDIYQRAVGHDYGAHPLEVFFYDNHLFYGSVLPREVPERVWFPPNAFSLERAVNLQNIWRLNLTMMALKRPPSAIQSGAGGSGKAGTRLIVVRRSETTHQLARKHAGANPSAIRVERIENQILALNPKMRRSREVQTWVPGKGGEKLGKPKRAKAMHVVAGEKVLVPA